MKPLAKRAPSWRVILLIVVSVAIYTVILVFSYLNMDKSLYEERATNTGLLMAEVTQNAKLGMDAELDTLHHFANIFMHTEMKDIAEARAELAHMRSHRPSSVARIFIIDRDLICHFANGEPFRLASTDTLSYDKDECYIDSAKLFISEQERSYMFFLTPFETAVRVENAEFTHMGICVEMSFLNSFFDTSEYGEESAAFIARKDGEQIYHRTGADVFGMQNIFEALSSATFFYDMTAEQVEADIRAGKQNCVGLEYEGRNYYLAYRALGTNDWMSLLLIPEGNVGSAGRELLFSIITSIVTIALGAVVLLVIVVWLGLRRTAKQREAVNEQLRRAVEAERSANTAKTQFLSSMSHDIRTPLNAIVGMQALAMGRLDEPEYVKECLTKASLASEHLLTLINDVLDISKVESGKMTLAPSTFSFSEAVLSLISILRPQADEKTHDVVVNVHNIRYERFYADELRFNQIFINLLSNAVKYTPKGGKIVVDIREEPISGREDAVLLTVSVEDNGMGMSEEFQKHMYSAFARASGESAKIQGTGLGLAICRQMVDLMGGTLECDSEEGRGTKFTVALPLTVADPAEAVEPLPPARILLTDCDTAALEAAAETFRGLGADVDACATLEDTLAAIRSSAEPYALIVIDEDMPTEWQGMETARAVLDMVDARTVVAVGAYDPDDLGEDISVLGFVQKPFFRSNVSRDVSRLLGLSHETSAGEEKQDDSVAGMRLLVAEDNDLNWEIASALLGLHGVITTRAENGRVCVEMLESAPADTYDMVLMDIQMPLMNGYEAAVAIRASKREDLRVIPIVAMTADAFAEDVQRAMEVGMNAHVAKPIDINNLLEIIGSRGGGKPLRCQDQA